MRFTRSSLYNVYEIALKLPCKLRIVDTRTKLAELARSLNYEIKCHYILYPFSSGWLLGAIRGDNDMFPLNVNVANFNAGFRNSGTTFKMESQNRAEDMRER